MQISPWPSLYIPDFPVEDYFPNGLPALRLNTTEGMQTFTGVKTRMYVCGITPYDSTHLGHASTYLTFDLINRYIAAIGGEVHFVENVTDIDEPLLERAARDGISWQELGLQQVELFQSDMTALHVIPPEYFVPATAAMTLVDSAISRMKERGFVYEIEGDLYFDVSSFLPRLPIPHDEAVQIFSQRGGDPFRVGKRHPLDPVLWWAHKDGEPGWESSHGFGRPGWHIECCVISLRYLRGENYLQDVSTLSEKNLIDIQGGGSDLLFPHHFMSGAQAEAITGIEFAKAYVHSGMLGLDGEKMSKSKGNLLFVSKLLEKGVDPMEIRWALMSSKYSEDRMWTDSVLHGAREKVAKLRRVLSRSEVAPVKPLLRDLVEALSNDLDTPTALAAIERWCDLTERQTTSEGNLMVDESGLVSRAIDSLLGLAL
jgi:L-cysteine:1D-myo-inositol 2-amino-2-deoxy-alpha-D-glucopyranoside ligase